MKASDGAGGAVMASSAIVGFIQSIPDGLVSMAVGLLGVSLARWVFVNREVRRLGRRETWRETLPLTLTAMLIAAVIIYDRKLGLSGAAFVGLGVGWVAVLILDILGERALAVFRTMLGAGPAQPSQFPPQADHSGHDGQLTGEDVDLPPDMEDKLVKIDRLDTNP